MLKLFLGVAFLCFSQVSKANPLLPGMSVRERLRLSLWYEGLETAPKTKGVGQKQYREELERALRKI